MRLSVKAAVVFVLVFVSMLLGQAVPAQATPLVANSCVGAGVPSCPGTLSVLDGTPETLLASLTETVVPLSGSYTGTLYSAVYRNASGTLDFMYQFANDPASPPPGDSITRLTANPFTGFSTDVGYRTDPLALAGAFIDGTLKAPLYADRNAGSVVGFSFLTPSSSGTTIGPGESSAIMVVSTNAIDFRTGFASVIDGGATTVYSLAPVPEPATLSLLGAAIVGFSPFVWRRRRRQSTGPRCQ